MRKVKLGNLSLAMLASKKVAKQLRVPEETLKAAAKHILSLIVADMVVGNDKPPAPENLVLFAALCKLAEIEVIDE